MLSFPMTRPPNLPTTIYGCPPEQSEGSASFPVSTCPPLPLSPRFLSSRAPFPILVPFVFNSLRTLLQFSALFCTASPTPPLCFQSLTHSFALLGGRGGGGSPLQGMSSRPPRGISLSFTSSTSSTSFTSPSLTPLESALPSQLRVSPCLGRNRPPVNPLESALPRSAPVTSLESALAKNMGGVRVVV